MGKMKFKSFKRALTATLAATMLMASTLTAAAAGTASSGGAGTAASGGSDSGSENEAAATESTASESDSAAAVAESLVTSSVGAVVSNAGAEVKIAGMNVKTTIAGAVVARSVQGVAVVSPLESIKASLGLKGNEIPYIMVFDTNAKKSPLAMECVNAVVTAMGGQYVTALNVELGAKSNGKFVSLSNGNAAMVTGLPKTADTSKTYSVICVQPKGVVTILEDQDTNPATVTFEIKAGLGTYAIVAK